jgi:hypothetical protein
VQFGEGRSHTRRQQTVAQLSSAHSDKLIFKTTLTHLTGKRLLTIGDTRAGQGASAAESENAGDNKSKDDHRTVDIAHGKLINGWPAFLKWIDAAREGEETRRTLERKTNEWVRLGRKRFGAKLLDKIELAEYDEWITSDDAAELGEIPELHQLQKVSRTWVRLKRGIVAAIPILVVIAMGFWIWGLYGIAQKESERAGEACPSGQPHP